MNVKLPKIVTKLRPYNELDHLGPKPTDLESFEEFTTYDAERKSLTNKGLGITNQSIAV